MASASFEVWRLILVGRLILNSVGIFLVLLSCLLLRRLLRGRSSNTSILTLLYLCYAELAFSLSSQAFSVIFLASHSSEESHSESSPTQHNRLTALISLAACGSLKHSSLFLRQWWMVSLCCLHAITKLLARSVTPLTSRRLVSRIFCILALLGFAFGAVRLVVEKIPEYFHAQYMNEQYHLIVHRALYMVEYSVPQLLMIPCWSALMLVICCADSAVNSQQQQQQSAADIGHSLNWSLKASKVVLAVCSLFVVCQGPLVLLDRVGADSKLFVNLQDLVASIFSCSIFVVLLCGSAAFRAKLAIVCTCNPAPANAARDTVLDSCYEMVATHA